MYYEPNLVVSASMGSRDHSLLLLSLDQAQLRFGGYRLTSPYIWLHSLSRQLQLLLVGPKASSIQEGGLEAG
jgi:hypothetical protein